MAGWQLNSTETVLFAIIVSMAAVTLILIVIRLCMYKKYGQELWLKREKRSDTEDGDSNVTDEYQLSPPVSWHRVHVIFGAADDVASSPAADMSPVPI